MTLKIKILSLFTSSIICLLACNSGKQGTEVQPHHSTTLSGTYRLIENIIIKGTDTTHTVLDTSKTKMIKMFNDNYFAFFNHDLKHGKDTSNILYVSGSGEYTLQGSHYKEHLIYCSYRTWEGHNFDFELTQKGDTLIQKGEENLPELGIKQITIEKYIKE